MKKILILITTISIIAYANHINWQGNYDKALQQAIDENKTLMVLLIKNDCQECKNIIKNLFMNKTYIDELNKNAIAVIVNIDNKDSFPLEMYWSNEYPTLFFVNSQNETFVKEPLYDATEKDIKEVLIKIKKNTEIEKDDK
ncbi:MAG: thioredoxin family protein [Epsilonproteobacteria bacterium]|nr:thioredoxin family protein [Campylobacterota bacterium]